MLDRLGGLAERQELCYWPPQRKQEFREVAPAGWAIAPQVAGDLGQRMEAFFERAFASGARRVVLIGSDTPTLPRGYIEQGLVRLSRVSAVLGPSGDCGYYLVGARGHAPPIFRNVKWSTPRVWEQTIDALERAGLRRGEGYATLPPWNDVDTMDDLRALHRELRTALAEDASLVRLAEAVARAVKTVHKCN
jgi:rSAM/selenodomain-associated transferase 1